MNFMKYNFVSNDFTIILITRRELSVSLEYSFQFIIILVDNFKLSNLREPAAAIFPHREIRLPSVTTIYCFTH